jgi:hypothetical protein
MDLIRTRLEALEVEWNSIGLSQVQQTALLKVRSQSKGLDEISLGRGQSRFRNADKGRDETLRLDDAYRNILCTFTVKKLQPTSGFYFDEMHRDGIGRERWRPKGRHIVDGAARGSFRSTRRYLIGIAIFLRRFMISDIRK